MNDDSKKIRKEFFDELIYRLDDKVEMLVKKNEGYRDVLMVALLTELNLNISKLNFLMMRAMDISEDNVSKEEPKKFICPYCKKKVLPNNLGYCPNCNGDLAKIAALERMHLGNVEKGE